MFTIFLLAVGISVLVFLLALRAARYGREDEGGFHAAPVPASNPPQAINPGARTRGHSTWIAHVNPWRQLPVHGQDEIGLLMACAVSRANVVSGFWVEWVVPPVLVDLGSKPRKPSAWLRRNR